MNLGNITADLVKLSATVLSPTAFNPANMLSDLMSSLSQDGNTVSTGRYDISVSHGTVNIVDTQTNTSVKAWGDPHLHTSDGDKMQFHKDNLTIDLQDGTKVTITVTEPNNRGLSFVDSVSIMKGDDAVRFTGVSDNGVIENSGIRLGQADLIDAMDADGTVLGTGTQVDDLFSVKTGREFVGGDPNAKFGEHLLDGLGGKSRIDFDGPTDTAKPGNPLNNIGDAFEKLMDGFRVNTVKGSDDGDGKKSIYAIMYEAIAKLENKLGDSDGGMVKDLQGLDLDSAEGRSKQAELLGEIQHIRQQIQQLTSTVTNLMKAEHDTHMAAINNLK